MRIAHGIAGLLCVLGLGCSDKDDPGASGGGGGGGGTTTASGGTGGNGNSKGGNGNGKGGTGNSSGGTGSGGTGNGNGNGGADDTGSSGTGSGNGDGGADDTGNGGMDSTGNAGTGGGGPGPGGTADDYQACVDRINAFRATLDLPPYARDASSEACTDAQAKSDSESGDAHGAFGDCGEWAQNECPGWGSIEDTIDGCLQLMWDEGPGGGHYENMRGDYSEAFCGFYTTPDGEVWAIQNFR